MSTITFHVTVTPQEGDWWPVDIRRGRRTVRLWHDFDTVRPESVRSQLTTLLQANLLGLGERVDYVDPSTRDERWHLTFTTTQIPDTTL